MKISGLDSPIIVIGMHRSGTSMFTRALVDAGIFMGVDLSTNSESYFFTECNEKLLKQKGASWHDPKTVTQADLDFDKRKFWIDYGRVRSQPWNALKLIKETAWGWKDPRNTFTLPYWISNHFPKARMIHVYRNGIDVAQSLQRRNQILKEDAAVKAHDEIESCFKLWETYLDQAFSYQQDPGIPQIHVSYEDLVGLNADSIAQLNDFLGIRNLEASLQKIVRPSDSIRQTELTQQNAELVQNSAWMKKLKYI